tara:strand:+ start:141459 stop:142205 length:747 start_codon:yes stop_codon:yes gene_type:complete
MKTIAMIPARYDASRFPGKLMKHIAGKPVITRTFLATLNTGLFDEVFVVTDNDEISNEIKSVGGNVLFSKKKHNSGSDRIAEVSKRIDCDIIVNVQGDEPFTEKKSLKKLIDVFKKDSRHKISLASLMVPINNNSEYKNPNCVKVVTDKNNFALYFSRSSIPHGRDLKSPAISFKHKGVYAFRKSALLEFTNLPISNLELSEKIECLRFLENGRRIKMVETDIQGIEIDTPADLAKANMIWCSKARNS